MPLKAMKPSASGKSACIGLIILLAASVSAAQSPEEQADLWLQVEEAKAHLATSQGYATNLSGALASAEALDRAVAHVGHARDENYPLIGPKVAAANATLDREVRAAMDRLEASVKARAESGALYAGLDGLLDRVLAAAVPQMGDAKVRALTVSKLVETVEEEYGEGVSGGKIVKYVEYDDAWGFLVKAKALYEGLRPELEKKSAKDAAGVAALLGDLEKKVAALVPPSELDAPVSGIRTELASLTGLQGKAATPAQVLAEVDRLVKQAVAKHKVGMTQEAYQKALSAYIENYEKVEAALMAKSPLGREIEEGLGELRNQIKAGAPVTKVEETAQRLSGQIAQASALLESAPSAAGSSGAFTPFLNSFIIILREGFEAALILGAVLAYLTKTGHSAQRRHIYLGAGAAIIASLATALLIQTFITVAPAHREALEGVVTLLAVAVLFYVSYWLISKTQAQKWQSFLSAKVKESLTRGSVLVLGSVAFTAVFREGFETVLFYNALLFSTPGGAGLVALGFAAGVVALAVVVLALFRFSLKVPLREFFIGTSAILYYLAFSFVGSGVHELQEAGWVGETPLAIPRVDLAGIYPTWETFGAQLVLLAALAAGLLYTFAVAAPRERKPAP